MNRIGLSSIAWEGWEIEKEGWARGWAVGRGGSPGGQETQISRRLDRESRGTGPGLRTLGRPVKDKGSPVGTYRSPQTGLALRSSLRSASLRAASAWTGDAVPDGVRRAMGSEMVCREARRWGGREVVEETRVVWRDVRWVGRGVECGAGSAGGERACGRAGASALRVTLGVWAVVRRWTVVGWGSGCTVGSSFWHAGAVRGSAVGSVLGSVGCS